MDSDLFDAEFVRQQAAHRPAAFTPLHGKVLAGLDDPECRIVLVAGPAGAGKTTLFAGMAQEHPDWLRYFARGSNGCDLQVQANDGLADFLIKIGLQLAALRPDLASTSASITVDQNLDIVGEHAKVKGASLDEIVVNPFRSLSKQLEVDATLSARIIRGDITLVDIGRIVAGAAHRPQLLADSALFDPAARLAKLDMHSKIVVLVDGADDNSPSGAAVLRWLTDHPRLPGNVRFVVASQTNPKVTELILGHGPWLREIVLG